MHSNMRRGHDALWRKFFNPETNLIYDCEFTEASQYPTPEEVARSHPSCAGWGTGMEDCTLTAGFVLDEAPLMRFALFGEGDGRYRFVWSFHHVLLDGWSLSRVLGEVAEVVAGALEGRAVRLARPGAYRDYVAWLASCDREGARRFWQETLRGFVSALSVAARSASPRRFSVSMRARRRRRCSTSASR